MATDATQAVSPATLLAQAVAQIIARQMDLGVLFGTAEQLRALGGKTEALTLYKTWIAYNGTSPVLYAAHFNYGAALSEAGDPLGAINILREAVRLKSDFFPPYINLGSLFDGIGQPQLAVETWLSLVNALPSLNGDAVHYKTIALKQIGRVLEGSGDADKSEDALRQSLEINPNQSDVVEHWIALRLRQCKWPALIDFGQVTRKKLVSVISPLSLACYADDPMLQLANAHRYNRTSIGLPTRSRAYRHAVTPQTRKPGRLRIGYVSSDFREHAVGFSMSEVIELHDRDKFEIFAYYCGIPSADRTHLRIKAAAEHWLDINPMIDEEVAARVRDDAIDILVDLNGYTKSARTKIFAYKAAPIQVNWFGFPSSMASPYHHYIVADDVVIPPEFERYYTERVIRVPCYQPNDRKRLVADVGQTRAEAGLPEGAFVFCSLNGMQKVTAITFHRWMTILAQVPDSVLWLLSSHEETNARLRRVAAERGIAPERLVFAGMLANPYHLARYPLADLFLDATPYGAHTTAADALWMGVPILTFPGRSFAARVCASVVRAAGIPELVARDADDYVAKAIHFGTHRQDLQALRDRLRHERDSSLLFDSPRFMRNLEGAYQQMWDEFARGELPTPDLTNLELYHQIGVELDLERIELLSDAEYEALYRDKIADYASVYPVPADQRLWPGLSEE